MKVYVPGKGIVTQDTIASNADEIGNRVAEGLLAEEDYWRELYRMTRLEADCLRGRVQALERKRSTVVAVLDMICSSGVFDRELEAVGFVRASSAERSAED